MGIKERRERQELRQAILVAARDLAGQEGWQAVTIRKVAERIEYSPPTIYEHFASKEAIRLELMRDGYRMLLADMRRATTGLSDPDARVLALARAYWEFAWQHPERYQRHGPIFRTKTIDGPDLVYLVGPEANRFVLASNRLKFSHCSMASGCE